MLIPQPFMGTIIGTGGSKIKDLREVSGGRDVHTLKSYLYNFKPSIAPGSEQAVPYTVSSEWTELVDQIFICQAGFNAGKLQ